jgi:hypothetical protein
VLYDRRNEKIEVRRCFQCGVYASLKQKSFLPSAPKSLIRTILFFCDYRNIDTALDQAVGNIKVA